MSCFRDARPKEVDKAHKTGDIFFVPQRRVCADGLSVLVVGLQACLGDVEAEIVEVLLVELRFSLVDGEAGVVLLAEDLPQVVAVLLLVNLAD